MVKFHWGLGIALAYIVFAASMIIFSITASKQNYDLVSQNYYDNAVAFQSNIDANANGTLFGSLSLTSNYSLQTITLSSKNNEQLSGKIFFYKPDQAMLDFNSAFNVSYSKPKIISTAAMAKGYWKANIEWIEDGKPCSLQQSFFIR